MSTPSPRAMTSSGDGRPTGRRKRGGGEQSMVPDADFRSYYGMPVVKPSPWKADIPAYIFFGVLSAGRLSGSLSIRVMGHFLYVAWTYVRANRCPA